MTKQSMDSLIEKGNILIEQFKEYKSEGLDTPKDATKNLI